MNFNKIVGTLVASTALFASTAFPAFAAGATQVNDCINVPFPIFSGQGCNFVFFDGNGNLTLYTPTSYHDVLTPSGSETEIFKGTVANATGQAVIYTANSGAPIAAGQTCYSFVTQNTTANWQETISSSGNYTLTCHFPAN